MFNKSVTTEEVEWQESSITISEAKENTNFESKVIRYERIIFLGLISTFIFSLSPLKSYSKESQGYLDRLHGCRDNCSEDFGVSVLSPKNNSENKKGTNTKSIQPESPGNKDNHTFNAGKQKFLGEGSSVTGVASSVSSIMLKEKKDKTTPDDHNGGNGNHPSNIGGGANSKNDGPDGLGTEFPSRSYGGGFYEGTSPLGGGSSTDFFVQYKQLMPELAAFLTAKSVFLVNATTDDVDKMAGKMRTSIQEDQAENSGGLIISPESSLGLVVLFYFMKIRKTTPAGLIVSAVTGVATAGTDPEAVLEDPVKVTFENTLTSEDVLSLNSISIESEQMRQLLIRLTKCLTSE